MPKNILFSFFVLVMFFALNVNLFSQQCELTVTNINFESTNSLTFDVFVKNTGASSVVYSHGSFVWTYNAAFLNGGAPTFSLVPGFSAFRGNCLSAFRLVNGFSKTTWGSPIGPFSGVEDGFVAKLDANGSLQWNTFLGGPDYDRGQARIVVDTAGNSYVTGQSHATWGTPVAPYAGGWDGYAAKLDTNGSLQWSTFVGGSSNEYGYGIALDMDGNSYVSGYNYAGGGVQDAFAAQLKASGSQPWSTSIGGSGWDIGQDVVVDTSGNSYVAGRSGSAWGSPVTPVARGGIDVLVAKLNANGSLPWHGAVRRDPRRPQEDRRFHGRRPGGAPRLPLARQRPRAPERHRARGDPLPGREDRAEHRKCLQRYRESQDTED